jgi:hypothetical protein
MTPTTNTVTRFGSADANFEPAVSIRWITSIDAPRTVVPIENVSSIGGKVVVVEVEVVVLVMVVASAITGIVVVVDGVASSSEQATNDNVVNVHSSAERHSMI